MQPPAEGARIGFITNSGGTVDLLYDYAEAEGAVAPDFTPATHEALMPHMQEGIAPKNPLDVGIPTTLKIASDQCEIVARDDGIDIVAWSASLPGKGEPIHGLSYLFAAAGSARLIGPDFHPIDLPARGIVAVPASSPAFFIEDLGGLDLIRIAPNWPAK